MDQTPDYLYKFRYFDADGYHIRVLTHNELFFPSPQKFNDPFDCKIPIRYDKGEPEIVKKHWMEHLKKNTLHSRNERRTTAKNMAKKVKLEPKLLEDISIKNTEKFTAESIGIYSLTSQYKNILLWSHYSQSHTGFAIGFDSGQLKALLALMFMKYKQVAMLSRINYLTDYPIINAYHHSEKERMELLLLSKAIDWEYEGEHRIIWKEGADKTIVMPEGLIKRVILGCQISDFNRDVIIKILKNRKDRPTLFQAHRNKESFDLNFKNIKY